MERTISTVTEGNTEALRYVWEGGETDGPEGGDTVRLGYSGMVEASAAWRTSSPDDLRYVEVPVTLWGDYCGSDLGRSNSRVLLRDYPNTFVIVEGGYGSRFLALPADFGADGDEMAQHILDIIEGLSDYPLISDEDHSELEMELLDEAWETYLGSDVVSTLSNVHGLDDVDPAEIRESFYSILNDACSLGAAETYLESAVSVVISGLDDIIATLATELRK